MPCELMMSKLLRGSGQVNALHLAHFLIFIGKLDDNRKH